ncbi:MAG: hypothetical protein ACYDA6_05265 [Solirubrobacteraceae bacterium]
MAGAEVVETGGLKVGVQPRNADEIGSIGGKPLKLEDTEKHPVLHGTVATYAIYWDPKDVYDGDWQEVINGFLANLGASEGNLGTIFAADSQYIDGTGEPATTKSAFHGAYTDTNPFPTTPECTDPEPLVAGRITCLTDAGLRTQLETFMSQNALPKGTGTVYYLLTPPGVTVCLQAAGEGGKANHCSDHTGGIAETIAEENANESYRNSFCSYHGAINPTGGASGDANTVLYAVIPWTAGGLGQFDFGPPLPAYDCQDGGFDPTSEPPLEKEHATGEAKKQAEAQRLSEEGAVREASRKRIAEIELSGTMTPEEKTAAKTVVNEETTKKLLVIAEESAKKMAAIIKQEALQAPRTQQPHSRGTGHDSDGDYDRGLADIVVNQISTEQQNIVTDPLLESWYQHEGPKYEATDLCRNIFLSPGGMAGASTGLEHSLAGTLSNQVMGIEHYYLNPIYVLSGTKVSYPGGGCAFGVGLDPRFTAPNPVNAGEVVGFDGMESEVLLWWTGLSPSEPGSYAQFTWSFTYKGASEPEKVITGSAPGAPGCSAPWVPSCAGSVFYSFLYGGTYYVTLTITDTGGHKASVTHEVIVQGTPRPVPPGSSPPTVGESTTTTTTTTTKSGSSSTSPLPAPQARAAAVSASLRTAIHHGLAVGYSVNEQVAGVVEALLNARTAHRLRIRGPLAAGLPAGYPQSIVIGRAALVTRAGGHGTLRLYFSRAVARALSRLSRVTLTLRMVVRNAERSHPLTSTLISTVTLRNGSAGRRGSRRHG